MKNQVETLRGAENWETWKWQMELILSQHGLFSIVDRTRTKPTGEPVTAEQVSQFEKENSRACSIIAVSVETAFSTYPPHA